MPNPDAVGAMAADPITAAPAVPAIRAAPARALVPIITAPIPAGAMPALIVPTIVLVIEGIVLSSFDCRPASPPMNRVSGALADAGFRAAREGRKDERQEAKSAGKLTHRGRSTDRGSGGARRRKASLPERARHLIFAGWGAASCDRTAAPSSHTVAFFGSNTTVPKRRRNEAPSWAAGSAISAIPPQPLARFRIKWKSSALKMGVPGSVSIASARSLTR